jgi:Short C-terminal domain
VWRGVIAGVFSFACPEYELQPKPGFLQLNDFGLKARTIHPHHRLERVPFRVVWPHYSSADPAVFLGLPQKCNLRTVELSFDRGSESPDGKEIWDGAGWLPLSEDKAWWWDGSSWRSTVDLRAQISAAMPESLASTNGSKAELVPDENQAEHDAEERGQIGPGGTGQVRELPNGAIVSANGYYYWGGSGWKPLVSAPPVKAPGSVFGKERHQVAHIMRPKGLAGVTATKTAGEELARMVADLGSLPAAEATLIGQAPVEVQVASTVEAGKMVPLQGWAIELIGGSPDFKSGEKVNIWMDNRVLELRAGFRKIRYELVYLDARAETQQQFESRVTATRLLAVGIFAFAFKKKSVHNHQYLTLTSTDPSKMATIVFETDGAAKLAAKIHAAAAPLQVKIADEHRKENANSPGTGQEDIPAKLRQLAELRNQGILTPEEFEAKKADLLSRM